MVIMHIFLFGLMSFGSYALERSDSYNPYAWRSMSIRELFNQASESTNNEQKRNIGEEKRRFAQSYSDKLAKQDRILEFLSRQTNGIICATWNLQLSKEDPNKIYTPSESDITPNEIDARWHQIEGANCQYKGPRKELSEKMPAYYAIGYNCD